MKYRAHQLITVWRNYTLSSDVNKATTPKAKAKATTLKAKATTPKAKASAWNIDNASISWERIDWQQWLKISTISQTAKDIRVTA